MRSPIKSTAIYVVLICLSPAVSFSSGSSAEALALPCNGCHGDGGVSVGKSIPSIAGQNPDYMTRVMKEYKEGKRTSTIMDRIAKGYKEYELRKIARYFSKRPWRSIREDESPDLQERGRIVHKEHCAECHEDMGRYQDKDVPRIAGQRPEYLYTQMMLYRDGTEDLPQPSEMAEKMTLIDDDDVEALAHLYGSID